jgi:hypothetical protein
MGNGFTFEVESLIFWAIASTVVQAVTGTRYFRDHRVLVYGDDIIVPSCAYDQTLQALKVFGFIPNAEKSYGAGPFRESCGFHGFAGLDVTPFYIRRKISKLKDLFLLHNNLVRWGNRSLGYRDDRLRELLAWVRSHAPEEWRKPRICDGYGDGAFIGSFDEVNPTRAKKWKEGWTVKVLAPKVHQFGVLLKRKVKRKLVIKYLDGYQDTARLLRSLWLSGGAKPTDDPCLDLPHYGDGDDFPTGEIPLVPGKHVGYKLTTCTVFQWHDLNPYLDLHGEFYVS